MPMKNHLLFVISGPSGVGKGTIVDELLKIDKDLAVSISCTTRECRPHEKEGVNYYYISNDKFRSMIEKGEFLEYSEHFGNYYGTPLFGVLEALKEKDVILEIDVNGGLKARELYPDCILIMIIPPSFDELKARLKNRNTESEELIEFRLNRVEYEMKKIWQYDYNVVNDDLNTAVNKVMEIISSERRKGTSKT